MKEAVIIVGSTTFALGLAYVLTLIVDEYRRSNG